MRYLIKFSYDGSCFNGFQRQNNLKTIQGEIEKVLTDLNQKEVNIHASGRTDKGAHANNQVAHFDLDKEVNLYNLKKHLNKSLNGEIYIKEIANCSDDFHARYNVKDKTYCYYINTGEYDPIERNYKYQLCEKLDISLMKEAVKCLIGKHDFRSFATDSDDKENTVREIYDISLDENGNIIKITFTGNGFLRKMIRNIVGVLIEIGLNKQEVTYLEKVLNEGKRTGNMKCSPACGLYLEEVNYN